jgi:tripartite-type tricarboxylate transporter receptor subunit TctC
MALAPLAGKADAYPVRPVRVIVPFAAGGSTDVVIRVLSEELGKQLGQPVIVDNRPGGAATIGMNVVARSAPDGYTLGVATLSFAANPSFLKENIPFNASTDLVPVSQVARMPLVLTVNPSVPVHTAAELVSYARNNPGKLNFGSTGIASSGHLGGALFESLTHTRMTHVPYSNSAVVADVVAGQLQVLVGPVPSSLPFVESGKLRALGVTSAKRSAAMPNVPTLAEAGVPGFEANEWAGIVVPKGTPDAVVRKLQSAIVASLQSPKVRKGFENAGAEVVGSTSGQFKDFIHSEVDKWARVAADLRASGELAH